MEERLKHRIVGLAVIVALLAIFAPLFFKNSQMPGREKGHTKYHAPLPPTAPQVHNAKKIPALASQSTTANADYKVDHIARINLDKPAKGQQNRPSEIPQLTLDSVQEAAKTVASSDQHRNLILGQNATSAATAKIVSPKIVKAKNAAEPVLAAEKKIAARKAVIKHIAKREAEKKIAARKGVIKHIAKRETEKKSAVKLATHIKSHKVVAKANKAQDWVIQMGVFSEKVNAEKLMKEMQAKGFSSFIRSAKNPQGQLIARVFVGPLPQRARADTMRAKILKVVKINGMVMRG